MARLKVRNWRFALLLEQNCVEQVIPEKTNVFPKNIEKVKRPLFLVLKRELTPKSVLILSIIEG